MGGGGRTACRLIAHGHLFNVLVAVAAACGSRAWVFRGVALYRAHVTRYVLDAPTLLCVVADDLPISALNQLVAPNLIRSQALSLLPAAV